MTHILIFIHWFVLVFTFGNVELVTIDNSKSNDFPIEELNNHTLREVFEKNLIQENLSEYLNVSSVAFVKKIIPNGFNYIRIMFTYDNVLGTVFYANSFSPTLSNRNINITTQIINNGYYSNVIDDFDYERVQLYFNSPDTNIYLFTHYRVPLEEYGISHLTVEQINGWFNVYQENSEREISDTYDYIENELTTNDLIYIVLFALLWGLAIKFVKGVM
ncbi:MAG: hypothetical protein QXI16_01275 [Sulfolobaceae archaeon]